jgi:hypothetical protein
VRVVGDHRRDVEPLADLDEAVAYAALDVEVVVHQLEEVVVLAEDLLVFGRRLERLFELAEPEPGLHLTGRAAGGGHQAARVLLEQLEVHAGPLADEPLGVGAARQLEQVVQALFVLGPDRLVGVVPATGDVVALLAGLAPADRLLDVARGGGDIGLDADDRGDAGGGRLPVEVVRAVRVAVVGHRDRGHALFVDLGEHLLETGRPVEHGVLGVHV